ncbi:MAG: hypothetical protein Alis3KO_15520 [Aliiglaciecola sp.]
MMEMQVNIFKKLFVFLMLILNILAFASRSAANVLSESSLLVDPTITKADRFGYSVALHGDFILVGAKTDESNGDDIGQVHLFSASTGKLVRTLDDPTPTGGDFFGSSVALNDEYIIVGASGDKASGLNSGQVHVFRTITGQLVNTLSSPAPNSGDLFGVSVDVFNDKLIIGASREDLLGNNVGKAYLFDVNTGQVIQEFTDPTVTSGDEFGTSVAVTRDNVFVGAQFDDTQGRNVGQVYMFDIKTANLLRIFNDPTPTNTDRFGVSIAVDGNKLLVGANGDDTLANGVGQAHLFNTETGALIYTFDDPTPTAFDRFGNSVSLDENYILVGDNGDDSYGINVGQTHVFSSITGEYLQSLNDPTISRFDNFGFALSVNEGKAIVGAYNDDTNGFSVGEAHVFALSEICTTNLDFGSLKFAYDLSETLKDPTPTRADRFGYSVDVQDGYVIVGSRTDETLGNNVGQASLYNANTGSLIINLNDPTPTFDDFFGSAVSVSEKFVVVGAPGDASLGVASGQAHVFDVLSGQLLNNLNSNTVSDGELFGVSVDVFGDYVLVGASRDDTLGSNIGKAYLFNARSGILVREFFDPTPTNADEFGVAVALSGKYAFIGAHFDDSSGRNVGQVHMFRIDTGALVYTFDDPSTTDTDRFGTSIDISGDSLLVGANGDDTQAPGTGQAHLFSISTGQLLHTFDDPTPTYYDRFGTSVAVSGNFVVVGDRTDDTYGTNVGQAHVYSASTGEYLQTLNDPTISRYDNFGFALSIDGNTILVGANNDDTDGFSVGQAHAFELVANCL